MTTSLLLLAFIEGLGGPELLMILFVTLLLFGGQKLPELARGLGKSVREFKKATAGVEEEIKKAIELSPDSSTPKALEPKPSKPSPAGEPPVGQN